MKRSRFRATYAGIKTSFPYKQGIAKKHVCLEDVTDTGSGQVIDDQRMGYGKTFQQLNLRPGDVVTFDAQLTRTDGRVRLTYPTKATKESRRRGSVSVTRHEHEQKGEDGPGQVDDARILRIRAELTASRRVIVFRKQFAEMAGDFRAGAMLSQIWYWFDDATGTNKPRASFEHGGYLWLNKSRNDWAKETGLTAKEARNAVKKLVEAGLVISMVLQTPWHDSPSTCLRINWPVFARRYEETLPR